ncbi:hypothetical protein [Conexibacter sp. CPCC 206217]|uniref:hypothetical protein n=1 Tax=Conexibacter sp. CPCC 206217 TaxID=3064574 RepID=UPI00271F0593|nr:hypothetical protein [Conexibacter sp. CPCC 206217]MDO8212477.1 hypothetical protein [Conexibacter sp. CPCC 206217]
MAHAAVMLLTCAAAGAAMPVVAGAADALPPAAARAADAVPPAAATAAESPPSLPGPPPGAGAGFPLPPSAGAVPLAPAPGASTAIPAPAGPALVDGGAQVTAAGRLTLRVACGASGRASLSVAALRSVTLARAAYGCHGGRAAVRLRIDSADARRLAPISPALGRVTLRQGATTARLSVALAAAGRSWSPGFWSDGGLQCASPGPAQAYLVAPNFTVTPSTSIAVRPWVASYTADGGWRWLGLRGRDASRWLELIATPAGVAQWLQPAGALNPWTWGPIDVPGGARSYALGVFEVIYWYGGRPTYVWRYARSFVAAQPTGSYCVYG